MSRKKSSNIRWVLCAVNAATTVAANQRKGVVRSLIYHRTTGTAAETSVLTNAAGTTLLNLQIQEDGSTQLDLWDLEYQGLIVTNSTNAQVWIGIIAEGQADGAHPDGGSGIG